MGILNELNISEELDFEEDELTLLSLLRTNEMVLSVGSKIFTKELSQPQFNIMMMLKNEDIGLHQKEIINRVVSSKGNISIHIKKMLIQGYVYKKKDIKDKRHDRISLSQKGRNVLEPYEEKYRILMKSLFAGIPNKELLQVQNILEKLRNSCLKV